MSQSVFYNIDAIVLCLALFAGCLVMVGIGKWTRTRFLKDDQESKGGVNSLLGALFGLWGFVLAFTFNSAATRFENVRALMVDEANLLRNTLLRTESFPDSIRNSLRNDLRIYLEARINYYEFSGDEEKFNKTKQDAVSTGKRLWKQAVDASQVPATSSAANNMMGTLTNLFDVGAKRDVMLMSGIPGLISFMLFFLALVISFVGGFTSPVLGRKEWVVIMGFTLLACTIIYITIDLARPMKGLIKPDVGQEKIVQVRNLF